MRVLYILPLVLVACGNSQPGATPPNPAAAACIAHRTADQIACDDLFDTRAEIDACRAKVQARIDCTKDAGLDTNEGGSDGSHD